MFRDTERASEYRESRQAHWDKVARKGDNWISWGAYYHQRLREIYRFLVASGRQVLEIGCGQGDLLAEVEPSLGVGVDFSEEMVKRASQRHPELHFIRCDAQYLCLKQEFDVIILSDFVNDLWDVQTVFEQIARLTTPRTRIIINTYSRLWELPLGLAQRLGLATPVLNQNWLTVEDVSNLLSVTDFEIIRNWQEIIYPLSTPLLAEFCNRFLSKIWPFRYFALTNFIIARPSPKVQPLAKEPLVSIIVPARNEAGNIPNIITRTPEIGAGTELIFVEGHSTDNT